MPPSSPPSDAFIVNVDSSADSPKNENNSPNPFASIDARSGVSTAAVATGPFAALKRLFKENPAKVINGRYTINFRQFLILLVIISTLTVLWFMSSQPTTRHEYDHLSEVYDDAELTIASDPEPTDPAALERHRRVRGSGTKTSLKKIQFQFGGETDKEREERESRRAAVRAGMVHAWNGYKKHAWGHDEVRPVSGGFKDNFNGWGATMIDSLDTLVIMGLNKEFDEALEWVKNSFTMTKNPTSRLQFFETIIRYLGGLLSAYDLTGEKVLLDKAKELGDHTLNAFVGSFPSGRFTIDKSSNYRDSRFCLAEVGTIQLEYTRLSALTGNPEYQKKALVVFDTLATAQPDLPGLLPAYVESDRRRPYINYEATVGGMIDSYYEYLLKEWILLDGKVPLYKKMFETVASSISQYMVSRPATQDAGSQAYAILGKVSSSTKSISTEMEHLACFIGGSLAMGSKYFDRPEDMELAKEVTESCYQSYHQSATGLGPENMKFEVVSGTNGKKFKANPSTFFERGSSNSVYILRPETVESLWVLYRLTGEKRYQDQAWEIFQALEKSCRTEIAYSALHNVNQPGSHADSMESFFLAETMKYLYLIFSPPDVISLDDFVLNTEAHPIRRT
ncbi:hypothetical protein BGZ94_004976 [Podila epigama]|nr:hypothetical protein BGZ94_004976 [Podila epigama]